MYIDRVLTFLLGNKKGGIYFQSIDNSIHRFCFVHRKLHTPNSTFNFSGNHANDHRGQDIFVSSFTSCMTYCQSESPYECIGKFTFSIGNFTFSNPHKNSTATLPTNFSLNHTEPVTLFPGIPSRLPLLVKDLEGNNVSNILYKASFANKSNIYILILHSGTFQTILLVFLVIRKGGTHCVWMPCQLISHY